ncbi:hypothetical protein, partial [Priestia megaterium]|uniref:hypothetical protein n=1 Tax=Priestia megaterium TaxID=1404 RepID=UPI001C99C30E
IHYKLLTTQHHKFLTTTLTTQQPNITPTPNKTTNFLQITTHFLTSQQLKTLQQQPNSLITHLNQPQTTPQLITTPPPSTSHNPKSSNYKITPNPKFTLQTLIPLLPSPFPFTPPPLPPLPNLPLQYPLKTPYYTI